MTFKTFASRGLAGIILLVAACLSGNAPAEVGLEIFPDRPSDLNNIIIDNPPFSGNKKGFQIKYNFSCFRTNLRAVSNPLAPAACVFVRLKLVGREWVSIKFPATYLSPSDAKWTNPNCVQDPGQRYSLSYDAPWEIHQPDTVGQSPHPKWKISNDNMLDDAWEPNPLFYTLFILTDFVIKTATVSPQGDFEISKVENTIEAFVVTQNGLGKDNKWMEGNDGPVTNWPDQIRGSPDGSLFEMNVSLPGAGYPGQGGGTGGKEWGFCGGFYSPLMVFFDGEKPKFLGRSTFPIRPGGGAVFWPESGAPGYFLAYDRDSDGKITSLDELFGAGTPTRENGFDALKELDTNHDSLVDAKDKAFKNLLLWQDSNGDGVSQKKELLPISTLGIASFSLKYDGSRTRQISNRAELRQTSHFTFLDKKTGKRRKGDVIDVWLAPAGSGVPRATARK